MVSDQMLSEADIPATISRKLEDLQIKGVRQLYARLKHEDSGLRDYLELSDQDFAAFFRKVENFIADQYPEDLLERIHPEVHKKGVAVDRLHEPKRPKHDPRSED